MTWALVAGSALFWGLRLTAQAPSVPAQAQLAEPGVGLRGDLARVLGVSAAAPAASAAPEPAADARFTLLGVVTPRPTSAAREGVALIAVDGKPAKAFRVGSVVEAPNVLRSVSARGAMLGPRDGSTTIALSIAPPAAATTGTLPAATVAQPPIPPQPQVTAPPPHRSPRQFERPRQPVPAELDAPTE